jgi:regulator of replication initiation timing
MRLEKERQRATSRIQQLQAELSSMRLEHESLRKRLQERLASHEKLSQERNKELQTLKRAGGSRSVLLQFVCIRS